MRVFIEILKDFKHYFNFKTTYGRRHSLVLGALLLIGLGTYSFLSRDTTEETATIAVPEVEVTWHYWGDHGPPSIVGFGLEMQKPRALTWRRSLRQQERMLHGRLSTGKTLLPSLGRTSQSSATRSSTEFGALTLEVRLTLSGIAHACWSSSATQVHE